MNSKLITDYDDSMYSDYIYIWEGKDMTIKSGILKCNW